jgi:glycosyltransferase involved in cell wall biosynthesis
LVNACASEPDIALDVSPPPVEVRSPAAAPARPVRVLQVITRLNIGGPARHTLAVTRELRAMGLAPMLVYGAEEPHEGTFEDLVAAGACESRKIDALGRRVRPWSDIRALGQLTRLMFAARPDIVHTHTAKAGALGRLAALAYNATRRPAERCILVHTFHGHVFSEYFSRPASAVIRLLERGLAAFTDRIVTVSPRQRRDICQHYGIAPIRKAEVLDVGAELEPLLRLTADTRLRDAAGFEPHHVVFGYVGRFVPIKDLPTLVRGFAQVAALMENARLLLVGDGELRGAIESLVEELGIRDRVRFTGWVRDLAAIYGALDVAVLTSLNEGTPLVVLEAMAAGRPVLATAVGGVEDIVVRNASGLLIPPRDVAALADAMARFATPEMRQRFGETARRVIAARQGWHGAAERLAALYARLLAERRPADKPSSRPPARDAR